MLTAALSNLLCGSPYLRISNINEMQLFNVENYKFGSLLVDN